MIKSTTISINRRLGEFRERNDEPKQKPQCTRCGEPREDVSLRLCRKCRKADVRMILREKKLPIPWRWR